jgi:hypothetical protein
VRSEAERLDAPRSWRPRWRRQGLMRAAAVCVLLLVALLVLTIKPVASPPGPAVPCATKSPGGPPAGTVGFPLRLPDPAVLAVVRAGARVDVLVRSENEGGAEVVASDLSVLRTVGSDGVLYLAALPEQAEALAAIGAGAKVSVTVRAPS